MTKKNQSFVIWENQTAEITINVDVAGSTTAKTLTGATLGVWITSDQGVPASDAVLTYFSSDGLVTTTDVDGTADGIQFKIESSDTVGLSGTYFWEAWAKDTSSDSVPVATGYLKIEQATGSL